MRQCIYAGENSIIGRGKQPPLAIVCGNRAYIYSMEEFEMPVHFKNEEKIYKVRLRAYRYSYKLEVEVDGTPVMFERDDEGNWRAIISYEELPGYKKPENDLLQAIATTLEEIMK